MRNKFEISGDGSIFYIDSDGTINRIGKIDEEGNIEVEKKNNPPYNASTKRPIVKTNITVPKQKKGLLVGGVVIIIFILLIILGVQLLILYRINTI